VAIDADTGKLKWYFQETPHDVYDFDSNPEPVLIDQTVKAKKQRLVLHSSKNGYAYVFDRATGHLIRAFPYADSITWTRGLDENGAPIAAVIPGKDTQFTFCPGGPGARNRNHSAYSPRTGLWYTTSYELCSEITPEKQDVHEGDEWIGGSRTIHLNPGHEPHIAAFDPLTGAKRWSFNTSYLNASSLLATGGDLLFAGDVMGNAFALDARSGEKVWSFNTGFRLASPPVTFAVGRRQYIAMTVGGGTAIEIQVPLLWPETRGKLPGVASKLFVFALKN
jgi:alcohol dehydrogenase (cytochrome c)